jgi:hypothetical protein
MVHLEVNDPAGNGAADDKPAHGILNPLCRLRCGNEQKIETKSASRPIMSFTKPFTQANQNFTDGVESEFIASCDRIRGQEWIPRAVLKKARGNRLTKSLLRGVVRHGAPGHHLRE